MSWSASQASAISAVFDALNQSGMRWLVLRNYEGLPDENRAKDVDLGIDKRELKAAENLIKQTLALHGFDRSITTRFQNMRCSSYFKVDKDGVCSIKIDLMDGFNWRGAHIFRFDDLYKKRIPYRSFHVPDPVDDAVMLWLKPLMIGAAVKSRYADDIISVGSKNPDVFKEKISRILGPALANSVWDSISQKRLSDILKIRKKISFKAWNSQVFRSPLDSISSLFSHVFLEIRRRMIRPPGSFFAVVGPDGVGKTTFIESLSSELARVLVKDRDAVEVIHFRPKLFPNIKELLSGNNFDPTTENFSNPHRAKPASSISSLLRLIYYWTDYVLGYWLFSRRKCIQGRLLIFDRYYYDFIVDPRRSRINLPYFIRKLFAFVTPEPDLVFFLDCDADTVFSRKQELSRDEIHRQLGEYRKLCEGDSHRFVRLDASQPTDASVMAALKELICRSFDKVGK